MVDPFVRPVIRRCNARTVPIREAGPVTATLFRSPSEPLLCAMKTRLVRPTCGTRKGPAMPNIDLGARPLGTRQSRRGNQFAAGEPRDRRTDVRALQEILARHGVVCLRDQELTPAQYVAFAKLFGEIEPSTRERYWLPEQNEIYVISNVVENGRRSAIRTTVSSGTPTNTISSGRPPTRSSTASRRRRSAPTPVLSARASSTSRCPRPRRSGYSKISIIASHSKLNEVRAGEGKPVDESEFDKLPDVDPSAGAHASDLRRQVPLLQRRPRLEAARHGRGGADDAAAEPASQR